MNKGYYILNEELKIPIVDINIKQGMWHVHARLDGPVEELPLDWYRVTITGDDDVEMIVTSMKIGWKAVAAGDSITLVQAIEVSGV